MRSYQRALVTYWRGPIELNFNILWTGINGQDAALLQRRTVTGLDVKPLDVDLAKTWLDLVDLLEWEAEVAVNSTKGTETGVF